MESELSGEPCVLHKRCGTLQYMAPEVAMEQGYGMKVDDYLFGILLWQICVLKKPYPSIKSVDKFEDKVFFRGARPKVGKYWPEYLKETVQDAGLLVL
jgi:serine/threonine protein kinase